MLNWLHNWCHMSHWNGGFRWKIICKGCLDSEYDRPQAAHGRHFLSAASLLELRRPLCLKNLPSYQVESRHRALLGRSVSKHTLIWLQRRHGLSNGWTSPAGFSDKFETAEINTTSHVCRSISTHPCSMVTFTGSRHANNCIWWSKESGNTIIQRRLENSTTAPGNKIR